jgi:hypothetical protein
LARHAQAEGIWAFDCEDKELVLLILVMLAFLGDNPMQSEIACHVGLKGKFFCRCCWVKGTDRAHNSVADCDGEQLSAIPSDASSYASGSETNNDIGPSNKKGKETMQELVDRARRFLGVSYMFY